MRDQASASFITSCKNNVEHKDKVLIHCIYMSDKFYNKMLLSDSLLHKQYFKQMLDSHSPTSHKHSSFSPAECHVSQKLSSLMVYDEYVLT